MTYLGESLRSSPKACCASTSLPGSGINSSTLESRGGPLSPSRTSAAATMEAIPAVAMRAAMSACRRLLRATPVRLEAVRSPAAAVISTL